MMINIKAMKNGYFDVFVKRILEIFLFLFIIFFFILPVYLIQL